VCTSYPVGSLNFPSSTCLLTAPPRRFIGLLLGFPLFLFLCLFLISHLYFPHMFSYLSPSYSLFLSGALPCNASQPSTCVLIVIYELPASFIHSSTFFLFGLFSCVTMSNSQKPRFFLALWFPCYSFSSWTRLSSSKYVPIIINLLSHSLLWIFRDLESCVWIK